MATPLRISASSVKKELFEKPYDFSFFQGMRILEQIFPASMDQDNESEISKAITIKSYITLSPSPSDIQNLEIISKTQVRLTINLLSLAGIQGPLPTAYTELVIDRLRQKDTGLNDFLDIFNHRLALIYYKIYKKHTPGFDLCSPHKSEFGKSVLAVSGINTSYVLEKEVSPRIFLKYSGILWQRPRSLVGLEQILADFFKTKVKVLPFKGSFKEVDEEDWTVIGKEKGKNASLGETAMIGKKSWITSPHLIIEFGPFDENRAADFFKENRGYTYLKTFVEVYCGSIYTFDAHLLCMPKKPLHSQLGLQSQLSWTSVIGKRSFDTRIIVHSDS